MLLSCYAFEILNLLSVELRNELRNEKCGICVELRNENAFQLELLNEFHLLCLKLKESVLLNLCYPVFFFFLRGDLNYVRS
jgi:hypothetical protein